MSYWANQLGQDFTKLENNFWFCTKESKCDHNCATGCKDKIAKYIYTKGVRAPKNVKLGRGGFGQVFLGRNFHAIEIGAKYIDVTEKYIKLLGTGTYTPGEVIPALLGDVAFEATLQQGCKRDGTCPVYFFVICFPVPAHTKNILMSLEKN